MASGGTASGTTGGGGNGTPGNSACAACRVLRRKCTAQCLFAPYFPPDQPQRFAHVHKVFGVANVTKMLHNLPPPHREDCVNSLAYEADARVQDPVYGCVGAISVLQQQVAHLQTQLSIATTEISRLRETFAIAAATSAANSTSQVTGISNIMANSIATANGSSSSACGGSNNALLAIPSGSQGNGNGNCPPNGTQGPLLVQNAVKILT